MKFSIITVCYNSESTIERTLKSVASQNYPDIEHIIIDGASTDSTLQILKKYKKNIGYMVSEPDKGIYDAMNKGIKAATGDALLFLNSDDYFFNENVLSKMAKGFEESGADIVYGNNYFRSPKRNVYNMQSQASIKRSKLARNIVQHQTLFAKKEVFKKVGNFDLRYKIAADYDWELRVFLKHNISGYYIDCDVSNVDRGGASAQFFSEKERIEIMQKYFSSKEIFFYYKLRRFIKYKLYRSLRQKFLRSGR